MRVGDVIVIILGLSLTPFTLLYELIRCLICKIKKKLK